MKFFTSLLLLGFSTVFTGCVLNSYPEEILITQPETQLAFLPNNPFSVAQWNCSKVSEALATCRAKVMKNYLMTVPYQTKSLVEIQQVLGESTGYFNTETNLAYALNINGQAYSVGFTRPPKAQITAAYLLKY